MLHELTLSVNEVFFFLTKKFSLTFRLHQVSHSYDLVRYFLLLVPLHLQVFSLNAFLRF